MPLDTIPQLPGRRHLIETVQLVHLDSSPQPMPQNVLPGHRVLPGSMLPPPEQQLQIETVILVQMENFLQHRMLQSVRPGETVILTTMSHSLAMQQRMSSAR